MDMQQTTNTRVLFAPLICRVCGDKARGINFNVLTCASCKAFFRRNALRRKNKLRCRRNFNCKITIETRAQCVVCRLKKCFGLGMNPELIRTYPEYCLPKPRPLALLDKDRSTLSSEEWNLLSNVIHAYDGGNSLHQLRTLFSPESCLPIKQCIKTTFVQDFSHRCFAAVVPIIKRSAHVQSLSPDACRILITRNTTWLAIFQGVLFSFQINYLLDRRFALSFIRVYGSDLFQRVKCNYLQMDNNEILHKMMLFVTAFFSNGSLVTLNSPDMTNSPTFAIELVRMQDIYVTVLWKYLLYQYGFRGAVQRYCFLIKTVLNGYGLMEKVDGSRSYEQVVDTTIKQFEHSLTIEESIETHRDI